MLSAAELVRTFADIVSKNGNLLLNLGPMADGTIPELQRERLLALGRWLEANGEAIFGTRPWSRAEGRTREGIRLRFTGKKDALYAILLEPPRPGAVTIESLIPGPGTTIHLLGQEGPLAWEPAGRDLAITWPGGLPDSPAYALRLAPPPRA